MTDQLHPTKAQCWDPARYAHNAGFVAEMGLPVVDLLAPQPGERILDLGCGDGALTARLAELGCSVMGVDASAAQIGAAQARGLDARVVDAQALPFVGEFDAVFSNAALHWMPDVKAVIAGAWRALRPGGRFVAECGGDGNIAKIRAALYTALTRRGIDGRTLDPWHFLTPADYQARLTAQGFRVLTMTLTPRPTPLPGDITGWLATFAESFTLALPAEDRPAFIDEVRDILQPQLCDVQGQWTADYVRLRFAAVKPGAPGQE
jgi:trans-aconitate methyltransferase